MKQVICKNCGSNDLLCENGYMICNFCGSKFYLTADDKPAKESTIDLNADIDRLLQRCREDPTRAKKCAERILEIDPSNIEAKKIIGLYEKANSNGCYVATAVYGSYDCPEVWTLRRYRDFMLADTWYGRAFIRFYYTISPTLVKWFGKTSWFIAFWKPKLDRMVNRLNAEGVVNTPYQDKNW